MSFPYWFHKNYPYGQFGVEHLKKMQQGIIYFNEKKYWECHEELEEAWLEDRNDPARYVYWAIIQVAATLIHYRDQKSIGCHGMLKKAKEKFIYCREKNVLSELTEEFLQWNELESLIFAINPDDALEKFLDLYNFQFLKYPLKYFNEN